MSSEWTLQMEDAREELVKDVYAHFGLAVYLSQVIEESLTSLIVAHRLGERPAFTRRDGDDLEERAYGSTFGQLIDMAKSGCSLDGKLLQDLAVAKRYRNKLSHGYFGKRAAQFCLDEGCLAMSRELQEFQRHFASVTERIRDLVLPIFARCGMTDVMLQEEADGMLSEIREKMTR